MTSLLAKSLTSSVLVVVLVIACHVRCDGTELHRGLGGFEEYLLNMTSSTDADSSATAATGTELDYNGTISRTINDLLGYFRTVPRDHWSCCMLGLLAGNKGFHCQSIYYVQSEAPRFSNRAHNTRHPGMHGRDRQRGGHSGYDVIRSFWRCFGRTTGTASETTTANGDHVTVVEDDFHRCCYAATEERRQLKRAQQLSSRARQSRQQSRRRK